MGNAALDGGASLDGGDGRGRRDREFKEFKEFSEFSECAADNYLQGILPNFPNLPIYPIFPIYPILPIYPIYPILPIFPIKLQFIEKSPIILLIIGLSFVTLHVVYVYIYNNGHKPPTFAQNTKQTIIH